MKSSPLNSIATRPITWIGAIVSLVMVLAACAPAPASIPVTADTAVPTAVVAATAAPQATATTAMAEASLSLATDPKFGKILVDGQGMTLYMYTKDGPNQSNCSGSCAKLWPPLLTQGSPTLGDGVDASLVGSATLADGTKVVTYNKMPLYSWASDSKPGDITGLGVGGVWFLVSPTGSVVGREASISVATDPKFGKVLTDSKGMTLYMYTKDTPDTSTCTGKCAAAWPPLLTSGNPTLGDGVDKSLVGSAALADGTKIVTYNHMPLYYFAKDTKAGDITGQGVGGVWYMVSPEGKIVGQEASISVATDPKFGKVLTDSKGMTLYMYTKDTPDTSTCTGKCAVAWPPLLTSGSPKLGDGVDNSMVGNAALADGTKIVTYNHMPLYYFAKDTKPGDTTGQGVGGVWFMVSADGKIVGQDTTIKVASDSQYGSILVDSKGMALYAFTKDTADKSNCSANCLKAWPALSTTGTPTVGAGLDASLLGTATLADGTKIVTYNHMPLYTYAKDSKAGDTTGQGVGGVWFLVTPDGKLVSKPASQY